MNNKAKREAPIVSAHSDAIRIVPLHVPEQLTRPLAAGPAPKLVYRNGPLLANVEVFTIFWGTAWQRPPRSNLIATLNQFFDVVLVGALIDELQEYSVPAFKIGPGRRTGTITLTQSAPAHSVSDSAIQHMLQHEIATNSAVPQPEANTLYFVYIPPGVRVTQGGSSSCQAFCGYHNDISGRIFYAVMPYPGCGGCTAGLSVIDALTSTSSHELCEAITDPVPGQGWYDDFHGEIGDICAWKTKKIGDFAVQLEWSNRRRSCV